MKTAPWVWVLLALGCSPPERLGYNIGSDGGGAIISNPVDLALTAGAERLTVTLTTAAGPLPPAGVNNYSPLNVLAVWVEGPGGVFVKTIGLRAMARKPHLVAWTTKAGANNMDATTGASPRPMHGPETVVWDMSGRAGAMVADGTYTIRMETAEHNSVASTENNQGTFTFNRNGTASTQTGLSSGGFSNVSLTYSGR